MFYNNFTQTYEKEATIEYDGARWYILPGFAGANSKINNGWGFSSKKEAEACILKYQRK